MFGPCSASCGGGERVRPVRCVQKHGADVEKIPDSKCPPDTAPNTVEKCNLQHCPARYKVYTVVLSSYLFYLPRVHGSNNFLRPQNM